MLPQCILLCLLLVVSNGSEKPAMSSVPLPMFAYTAAKSYTPLAWLHGGDRFSSDAAVFVRDGKASHSLIPGFASSSDPAVSFDGQKILFSGKAHANDPRQIWEINADDVLSHDASLQIMKTVSVRSICPVIESSTRTK